MTTKNTMELWHTFYFFLTKPTQHILFYIFIMTTKKVATSGPTMETQLLNKALKSKKIPGSTPTEIGKNYKIIKKMVGSNSDIMDKIDKIYKDTLQEYLEDEPPKVPLAKEKTGFKDLPRELQIKIIAKSGMVLKDPELTAIFKPVQKLWIVADKIFDSYCEKQSQFYNIYGNKYEYAIKLDRKHKETGWLSKYVVQPTFRYKFLNDLEIFIRQTTNIPQEEIPEILATIKEANDNSKKLFKAMYKQSFGRDTIDDLSITRIENSMLKYYFEKCKDLPSPQRGVLFLDNINNIQKYLEQSFNKLNYSNYKQNIIKAYAVLCTNIALTYIAQPVSEERGDMNFEKRRWQFSSIWALLSQYKEDSKKQWEQFVKRYTEGNYELDQLRSYNYQ